MDAEPEWHYGTVTVPSSGSHNGVYIAPLQTDASLKRQNGREQVLSKIFLPALLSTEAQDVKNLKEGQLVRYQVDPDAQSMVAKFELP